MVFHFGIDPYEGLVSIFSTQKEKSLNIVTNKIHEFDKENAKHMFACFPGLKAGNKYGCACLCLKSTFDREIRKIFIETGIQVGFTKVEIIDQKTALYFGAISQTNYEPKNFDIIWIFEETRCHIWQKLNHKAQLVSCVARDFVFDDEDFDYVLHQNNLIPNVIFYNEFSAKTFDKNCVRKIFPKCQCFSYRHKAEMWQKAALLKARILGEDPNVMVYNASAVLDKTIIIKVGQDPVMYFIINTPLPLTKTILMNGIKDLCTISQNGIDEILTLPVQLSYSFTFSINESNIYDYECSTIFSDGNLKKKIENRKIFTKFFIPYDVIISRDGNNDVVGIDLGTTRCCAAVNRRFGIETVALDTNGQRLLPSYVAFDEEKEKCGQLVIERLRYHASATVFDAKRIIGKNFNEINVDRNWPFTILNSNNGPVLKLEAKDKVIKKTAEEIATVLLKHIKQKSQEFQNAELNDVVITVPNVFTEAQIRSTYMAAVTAGWKNIRIIPEPIAAILSYFSECPILENSVVLLFDLGGGTLDVCIYEVRKNEFKIISESGDCNLGGRDFDNILIDYFSNKLKSDYHIIDLEKKKYKLLLECQKIKETLSTFSTSWLDVEDIVAAKNGLIYITQEIFEKLSESLCTRIKNIINSTLQSANYKNDQIKHVLQVGGGCRMPMTKELLMSLFPQANHLCRKHPDEVVAIGAAYHAYFLTSNPANCYDDSLLEPKNNKPLPFARDNRTTMFAKLRNDLTKAQKSHTSSSVNSIFHHNFDVPRHNLSPSHLKTLPDDEHSH